MQRFRRIRSLQMFVSVHASVSNHFNQERSLSSRHHFKLNRTAALTEWRGLGAAPNTFAIECMVDELAAVVRMDPLAFRLHNLPGNNNRMATALQTVAKMSEWDRKRGTGTGLGIAGAIYKGETYVAVVAQVAVDCCCCRGDRLGRGRVADQRGFDRSCARCT